MNKFGRSYIITIQTLGTAGPQIGFAQNEFISFTYPLTLEFDIERKLYQSLNTGHFRLYNLSALHRNQIRHSYWDVGTYQRIQLRAGYTTSTSGNVVANLPVIFQGNITNASSIREGANFITTIEALDGGYAFNYPQAIASPIEPFAAGTSNQTIIETVAGKLPKVTVGAIGNYQGTAGIGASFDAPIQDILSDYTGNGFFVDNETANCLNTSEVIDDTDSLIINASTGLLNTPALENSWLYFDMIFEPRLYIGQQIILQSTTDFLFNGPAKVCSIHHKGTISGAVCGDAVTTVGLDTSVAVYSFVPRAVAR